MPDFDTALDRDWREFRRSLADRLADLPKGGRFELSCPDDPRYTGIACRITGQNRIRIELDIGSCPVDTKRLGAAGWRTLRSGAFVLDVGRRMADMAAVQVECVLREEWGILHPVFVFDDGGRPGVREPRLQIGVEPRNGDHLQRLLDDAIESLVCGPQREACKCIRFEVGGLPSWLRVLPDEKVLEFFTWLGPSEVPQSAHVIAEANARCRGVQVAAAGDRVFAAMHVDAAVFLVADLARALSRWLSFMSDHSGAIAHQLAGVVEPAEEPAKLPPGLQCLLQLDPEAAMSPHDVATVCGNDRDAILDYLQICAEQEATWRAVATEADNETEAEAADHEANMWASTAMTLREALRLVVLGTRGTANG